MKPLEQLKLKHPDAIFNEDLDAIITFDEGDDIVRLLDDAREAIRDHYDGYKVNMKHGIDPRNDTEETLEGWQAVRMVFEGSFEEAFKEI